MLQQRIKDVYSSRIFFVKAVTLVTSELTSEWRENGKVMKVDRIWIINQQIADKFKSKAMRCEFPLNSLMLLLHKGPTISLQIHFTYLFKIHPGSPNVISNTK
ncbi:Arylsulfate sulfotransferase AssT [Dirofilaria immitis]